jgi:hypothetical protein
MHVNIDTKNMSDSIAKLLAHEMAISAALSIVAANTPKGRELFDAVQRGLAGDGSYGCSAGVRRTCL